MSVTLTQFLELNPDLNERVRFALADERWSIVMIELAALYPQLNIKYSDMTAIERQNNRDHVQMFLDIWGNRFSLEQFINACKAVNLTAIADILERRYIPYPGAAEMLNYLPLRLEVIRTLMNHQVNGVPGWKLLLQELDRSYPRVYQLGIQAKGTLYEITTNTVSIYDRLANSTIPRLVRSLLAIGIPEEDPAISWIEEYIKMGIPAASDEGTPAYNVLYGTPLYDEITNVVANMEVDQVPGWIALASRIADNFPLESDNNLVSRIASTTSEGGSRARTRVYLNWFMNWKGASADKLAKALESLGLFDLAEKIRDQEDRVNNE